MRRVVLAAIAVAAVGLIGFDAPAQGSTTYGATMVPNGPTGFKFGKGTCENSPMGDGVFNLQVGDSVIWKNCTSTDHTVTGEGFGNSEHIAPQASVSYTFESPGTFAYRCDIHPSMTGSVKVTGEPTTTQTTPTTTATTAKPTTTKPTTSSTTSTTAGRTTTTVDIDDIFNGEPTSSTTSTTDDPTVTTRALGSGGDGGTSAGMVGLLLLGIGGVGTAAALVIRNMRSGGLPPN